MAESILLLDDGVSCFEEKLTYCRPVVKHDYGTRLPSHTGLEVMTSDEMLHEEVLQDSKFRFLESLNLRDEFTINKETFLASHGVHADKWVHALHRILAH